MNERLKQLAKQAGAGEWGDNVIPAMMNIEKFAELIVQECVRHFNEDYKRDFMVSWREDLSNSILNHFGIKE